MQGKMLIIYKCHAVDEDKQGLCTNTLKKRVFCFIREEELRLLPSHQKNSCGFFVVEKFFVVNY